MSVTTPTTDYGLTKVSYSAPETAALLSICRRSLDKLVAKGRIRRTKIGKRSIFLRQDVAAFIDSLRQQQG